jgi:hypothetical protein
MPPSYNDFEPNRIKHMEMLQAVIARLAGNSFLMKGWALTLTVAFLGLAVNKDQWGLAASAVIPISVFWLLDTYYLRAERLFRSLYERVRARPETLEPFFMGATSDSFVAEAPADVKSWRQTVRRGTLSGFYGLLIGATVLVAAILCID